MYKRTIGEVPLWQFDQLAHCDHLQHFVSGREGGVSQGERGSLNLSYQVGDTSTNVDANRLRIAQGLHIPIDRLIFPQQTHSCNVRVINEEHINEILAHTDGLITATPNICIGVLAADCVPILLFDVKKRVIGAVHSGWRGTVGKILTKTIEVMQSNFHTNAVDIKVGIGPSIGPQVYEVGQEVITAVHDAFPDIASQLLQSLGHEKALFNLWEANKQQLISLGIPEANIAVAGICTFKSNEQFFSARASSIKGGRFGAGIMLVSDV